MRTIMKTILLLFTIVTLSLGGNFHNDSLIVQRMIDKSETPWKTFSERVTIENGRITELFIGQLTLTYELGKLDQLKRLKVEDSDYPYYGPLPRSIGKLQNLEEISGGVIVTRLPEEIQRLKNLRILEIEYVEKEDFPEEILSLRHLEKLTLWGGNYKKLPRQISSLKHLKYLQIGSQNLKKIPRALKRLKNLEYLYISSSLEEFPLFLTSMESLKSVHILSQHITSIPKEAQKLADICTLYNSKESVQ